MLVKYVVVVKINGANRLPDEALKLKLVTFEEPKATVTLETDPSDHLRHVDTSLALANQILKVIFAPEKDGTPQERLAAEIQRIGEQRQKKAAAGVFLVFVGELDEDKPDFKYRRDSDDFAVCFDAVDKDKIRAIFDPYVRKALFALALCLPPNADRQIEKIGSAIYLVEPGTGKPIYTFHLQPGSFRASLGSPITPDVISEAALISSQLIIDSKVSRPAELLIRSLERNADPLEAFITAWSAVEIFVHATFKQRYEAEWFKIMETGAPASGNSVFKRFEEVMHDKYRVADKFLIIASVLAPEDAIDDTTMFGRVKSVRDKLLHGQDIQTDRLPTEDIQNLALKYLKLHLDRASD